MKNTEVCSLDGKPRRRFFILTIISGTTKSPNYFPFTPLGSTSPSPNVFSSLWSVEEGGEVHRQDQLNLWGAVRGVQQSIFGLSL